MTLNHTPPDDPPAPLAAGVEEAAATAGRDLAPGLPGKSARAHGPDKAPDSARRHAQTRTSAGRSEYLDEALCKADDAAASDPADEAARRPPVPLDDLDSDELAALILDCLVTGRDIPHDVATAFHVAHRQDVFEHCVAIAALPRSRVPDAIPPDGLDLIEAELGFVRRVELQKGAAPSALERQLWRQAFIRRALLNDDADLTSSVNLVPLSDAQGRWGVAVATVRGYSFSGVEITWHGFALTRDGAFDLLRPNHYLSVDEVPDLPVLVTTSATDRSDGATASRPRRRRSETPPGFMRMVK